MRGEASRRQTLACLIGCGILLAIFAETAWTAWLDKCATWDEPLHLIAAWLQVHYDDFRCDPEDPDLWRYYIAMGTAKSRITIPSNPALWESMLNNRATQGLLFHDVFYGTPGNDVDTVISAARARMLLLGVALGAVVAWWAWRLHGPLAALVACAAFCLDPNFLAHSPLVKNDVAISLALLLMMMAIWLLGRRATGLRFIAVALAVGAALTVKFSGVLAIPLLGLSLAFRAFLPEPWPILKWTARTRLQRLAFAAALATGTYVFAYVFIWAVYCFRFGPSSDPHQLFDFDELLQIARAHAIFAGYHIFNLSADQIRQWNAHWQPNLVLCLGFWANDHRLLPQSWLEGLLFTYGNSTGRAAFLLGKSSMYGWWYYFPLAMALKTPVATIAAFLLAAGYGLSRWRAAGSRWWDIFAVALMPVLYMAAAMRSELDLGVRHVLPVYPFLFIFIGVMVAHAWTKRPRITGCLAIILMAGLLLETYQAYPDFIPFFNEIGGGWQNGPQLLGGSNIDWGQDLPALAQWQQQHPDPQLFLYYSGSADPRYYGIRYVNLPGSSARPDQTVDNSRPRVYALSATAFQDPFIWRDQGDFYKSLQTQRPIAVLGRCIYLYNPP
jgi:4-amino-4-deoxy-L-arabinose transferase-like glycosyltransferase